MADFTYEGSGGIVLGGCADPIKITKKFSHKFGVGSVVYVKKKANRGKLKAITIKEVARIFPGSPSCAGIKPEIRYTDNSNRRWFEDELVWQSEAVQLATEYWEAVLEQSTELLNDCSAG